MKRNYLFTYSSNLYKFNNINVRSMTKVAKSGEDALSYCANLIRQHDYENFLSSLLMTKSIRSPAMVLRAFNVEVARIQDQTSDAQTAEFRLQFWQDTIKDIYKNDQKVQNVPHHPVARELFKVCTCYKLSRRHLERLITARGSLLKTKYFRTLEDLERYADDTVSTIYYLILSVAGVANVHADHAASHLGKAQGITNTLRSIHVSNHHKMVSIPMDVLMRYQISQEQVLRGIDSENMRNATFEMASRANSHLEKARKIEVPQIAKQIFLPAIAVNAYLSKLQKCHFNLFDKSLTKKNVILPINLYYNRLVQKY